MTTGSGAIAEGIGAAAGSGAPATGAGVVIEVLAFPVAEGSAATAPTVNAVARLNRVAHR